jgi:hypothetical protein
MREGEGRRFGVLTTRIGAITWQSGLDALVTGLLRGRRSAGGRSAFATRRSRGNERLFVWMAFVDVSREEVTE